MKMKLKAQKMKKQKEEARTEKEHCQCLIAVQEQVQMKAEHRSSKRLLEPEQQNRQANTSKTLSWSSLTRQHAGVERGNSDCGHKTGRIMGHQAHGTGTKDSHSEAARKA